MEEEAKNRIVKGAEQLFYRYGIKSITMDEVARHLAISKKTLYQFFENKDELVYSVAQGRLAADCIELDQVVAKATSALHMMVLMTEELRKHVGAMHPNLIYDLQRFHPRAWSLFSDHKENVVEAYIELNLRNGIREGSYRPTIDVPIMARARMQLTVATFDPAIFPPEQFPLAKLQLQLLEHFVLGLLTDQGRQQWEEMHNANQPLLSN